MNQTRKDYLILHFIILLWSFTAIIGLLMTTPPVEVVLYRTLFAAIVLFFIIKWSKRPLAISNRQDLIRIISVGFLIALHWVLFFLSARVTNVSVCLAGMATCPLWTSIVEPIFNKRKIKGYEVILGFFAFIGIGMIFIVQIENPLGLILAIISAFAAAVFSVINGQLVTKNDSYVLTMYEMVFAFLTVLLFLPIHAAFFTDSLQLIPSWADIGYLVVLAVVCTVYAFSVSIELMKRLSVFAMNLSINLEPVYGIILALIIFGKSEEMSWRFYLGTAIILLSVVLYPVINSYYRRRALSTDIIR